MDSQDNKIDEKVEALWPEKQIIEGTIGYLKYFNPISNAIGYGTGILINETHYVFDRSTCSYLTQLQFSIGYNRPYITYHVANTYILNKQTDSTIGNESNDYAIVRLLKSVENTESLVSLFKRHSKSHNYDEGQNTKQLQDYEEKVEKLQDYITKIEDHFDSLVKYFLNLNPYTKTQYILQSFLNDQICLYGEYSLKTIKTRKSMAYVHEQINGDKLPMIEQYVIIASVYEKNEMTGQRDYANALYEVGSGYSQLEQYQLAIRYLEQALNSLEELGYPSKSKLTCARQLIDALQQKGLESQAIRQKYGYH